VATGRVINRIVTAAAGSAALQRNELANQARVVGQFDTASGEQADRVEVDLGSISPASSVGVNCRLVPSTTRTSSSSLPKNLEYLSGGRNGGARC
jgi:hypothetical protein